MIKIPPSNNNSLYDLYNELVSSVNDTTKHDIASGKLKASQIRRENLDDSKDTGILLKDRYITRVKQVVYDQTVKKVNDAMCRVMGATFDDIPEFTDEVIRNFSQGQATASWEYFSSGKRSPLHRYEFSMRKQGEAKSYNFCIVPCKWESSKLHPAPGRYYRQFASQAKQACRNVTKIDGELKQVCQTYLYNVRLYKFIAQETEKEICDLTTKDIQRYSNAFQVHLEAEVIKDFEREQIAPTQTRASGKRRKRHKKSIKKTARQQTPKVGTENTRVKKAPPLLTEMQQKVHALHEPLIKPTKYTMNSRITDWQKEEDSYQRDIHNLAGMHHFLENDELLEEYSFPYEWDKGQKGRAFFVEMRKGTQEKGIYMMKLGLGVEDRGFYHAHCVKLKGSKLSDLRKALEAKSSAPEEPETPWEGYVSDYFFDLSTDKKIELHVGKQPEQHVVFKFHKL